ncbi:hypothetical protein SAMN04489730_1256 [Amycolatopsis australiensis]|uniref:Uncharacterized protein n=1 Tax=Amycolatopsis australiensis TaxID=546364 RepID=A0A1K1Q1F3_9PSEU|nr:hypothetical protein SAMN04489730_1256 [Amycolatopsis australiensis]
MRITEVGLVNALAGPLGPGSDRSWGALFDGLVHGLGRRLVHRFGHRRR